MEPKRIFDYITERKYPKNYTKNEKRQLRLTASKYIVKENKLFWINRESKIKEVPLERNECQQILAAYHDERGHLGIERTYHAISRQFYWKNLYQDVRKYVKSCGKCQKTGSSKRLCPRIASDPHRDAMAPCMCRSDQDAHLAIWQ